VKAWGTTACMRLGTKTRVSKCSFTYKSIKEFIVLSVDEEDGILLSRQMSPLPAAAELYPKLKAE